MKQRWIISAATACSLLVLAACGGGAGTSPSTLPAAGAPQGGGANGTMVFTVKVPQKVAPQSAGRTPKYLTPAVQGIDFTVTAADGSAPLQRGYVFYPLTPQATYCATTGGNLVCTLAVQAMPGSDLFTVNTYDGPNPNANYIVSSGFISSTVVSGATNSVNIVTNGVPTNITASLDNPFPAAGTPVTQPIHITAADADNYIIVGPYDMPITIADPDTSGHTSLSTASLASSATVPNLIWDGTTVPLFNLTVQDHSPAILWNGGGSAKTTFAPGIKGVTSSPAQLYFAHTNASAQTITLGGPGTSAPYLTAFSRDLQGDPSCSGIVSVSGTSPTFTVTPLSPGTCGLYIYDSSGGAPGGPSRGGYVAITVSP